MTDNLHIEALTGINLERYVPDLAHLRIEVFRDFPYLYDGSLDYEAKYLQTYIQAPDSVIVIVRDGARVVGASTAVPLVHETANIQKPFIAHGYDPRTVFYLGESVLLKHYRGRGIGVRFFTEREAHAQRVGDFAWSAFCAVDRPPDHPRRPMDYVPLDAFWQKRGYVQHPEITTTFFWRDLDETAESEKPMTYWLKALR